MESMQKAQVGAMDIEVDDLAQLDDVGDWSQLIHRLAEIAQRRSQLLAELRQALLEEDTPKVLRCAGLLCGVEKVTRKRKEENK